MRKTLATKLAILTQYCKHHDIDPNYVGPSLVAHICIDILQFDLTSDEVVWLSYNL